MTKLDRGHTDGSGLRVFHGRLVGPRMTCVAQRDSNRVRQERHEPLRLFKAERLSETTINDQRDLVVGMRLRVDKRHLPSTDNDLVIAEWAGKGDFEAQFRLLGV